MEKLKPKPKEIIDILVSNEKIGSGGYGLVISYNYDTLIKLYHNVIFSCSSDLNKKKIVSNIEFCKHRFKSIALMLDNYNELLEQEIEKMEVIKSIGLLKCQVFCRDYLVGVLLTYYKDYICLDDIAIRNLSDKEKLVVLNRVKEYLQYLMTIGIYAEDLKEKNIMVRLSDLDVKIIDLDDCETLYIAHNNIQKSMYSKSICMGAYEAIKRKLL